MYQWERSSFVPGLGEEGGNTDVERRLNEVGDEGGVTFGNQCD